MKNEVSRCPTKLPIQVSLSREHVHITYFIHEYSVLFNINEQINLKININYRTFLNYNFPKINRTVTEKMNKQKENHLSQPEIKINNT